MKHPLFYIFSILVFFLLLSAESYAQELDSLKLPDRDNAKKENVLPPEVSDSIIPITDVKTVQVDSTEKDSAEVKKSFIVDDVDSDAKDYMRYDKKLGLSYLYNEAKITYQDMTIEAGLIILNKKKNEVYAFGIKDSTGKYTQRPVFTQGQNTIKPDSIRFNFDTNKALVYNSRTKQGGFNVIGETTKRENDSVYFMENVKLTTAEDIDNPEYYFYARKIKFMPDKKIVSGFVNMYIADVPTPLGLPFGYFPMTDKRASGFIIPSFGDNRNRGYFLQNGGYYFAINDYMDLAVVGDYYTNGSYGLRFDSNYRQRYKYKGNVSFRYENLLNSERGFPDFSKRTIYNIRWSHSQAAKASPNSRFSASVNLGSSNYYQQSVNQTNTANFLNNSLNSSVTYSKTYPGDPQVNLNISATHQQNTRSGDIDMTLPTFQGSVARIYPFAPESGTKSGIIDNINFQYNLRAENRYNTNDSIFFKPEMFRDANSGFQHSIPINTNFKLFNYFSVSAGTNYEEKWVFKTFEQSYDVQRQENVIDTVRNFDTYRTYNFNASIGTSIYGMFNFGEDSKIKAIRHTVRPSVGYNNNPAFDNFYDTYLVPATSGLEEDELVEYSRFEGTLYGAPSSRRSSSVSLSVTNNFEAKVAPKDSTKTELKKIDLLKNLQFSTSYDLARDSLNLSPLTFRGTLPVVQDEFDINFNGALDPYALNNKNRRTDKLNIDNGGSLFRLTRANVSFGYNFSSKDFINKDDGDEEDDPEDLENESFRNGGRPDDLFGKSTNLDGSFEGEEKEKESVKNETKRYNYKIPWDLRLSYTMTYNNTARQNEISSHSIMFSGNVEFSPRWKVGISSGYDLRNKGFTYTQLRFQRDLKSWRMSFNWTPFGRRKSWYFYIGIKSSVLSDIKYDKNRERARNL